MHTVPYATLISVLHMLVSMMSLSMLVESGIKRQQGHLHHHNLLCLFLEDHS